MSSSSAGLLFPFLSLSIKNDLNGKVAASPLPSPAIRQALDLGSPVLHVLEKPMQKYDVSLK